MRRRIIVSNMKKVLLFIGPFLVAVGLFLIFIFLQTKEKGKGALQVTALPKSNVYLNGNLIGQTPLCDCKPEEMLNAGDYMVKVDPLSGNSLPFEQKITINKGVLTVVDRTFGDSGASEASIIGLVPLDNNSQAQLLVISFPDKAQVFLDDNVVGTSPLLLQNVTASDHEIRLTHDGYKDKILRISTVDGYKLTATVFLGIASSGTSQAIPSATATPSVPLTITPTPTATSASVLILQTPNGFLNVRAEPSVSSAIIATVKPGQTFPFVEQQTGWFEIQVDTSTKGWVSSSYSQEQ